MEIRHRHEGLQEAAWRRPEGGRHPRDEASGREWERCGRDRAEGKKNCCCKEVPLAIIFAPRPRNADYAVATAHIAMAMRETMSERGRMDENDHQHSASADLKPLAQEPNPKNTKFEPTLFKFRLRQQKSAHLKRNPRSSLSIVDSSSIASTRCRACGGVCEAGHG
jgi:hypothetical protein